MNDDFKRINQILNATYNFSDVQKMVFDQLKSGIIISKIAENCSLSKSYSSSIVKQIKNLTGLTTSDIRYIQKRNKDIGNKLSQEETLNRKNIAELICKKYLGFNDTKSFPSFFYIRLAQLRKQYSYKIIYITLLQCEKDLDYVFSHKDFNGISHKINYIFIVLKSKIDDVKVNLEKEKETKLKTEINDNKNIEIINNIKNINTNIPKKKDFSKFLDENNEREENNEQGDLI